MGRRALGIAPEQTAQDEAIAWLSDQIKEHLDTVVQVKIDTWHEGPWGLRITEIALDLDNGAGKTGNAIFLAGDVPNGLAACAQAERVILDRAFMDDEAETHRDLETLLLLIA